MRSVPGGTEHLPILNPLGMIRKWISGYFLMRAELICVECGSGFRVLGSRLGSGFRVRSRFLVHGFRFKCRVRNIAVAPIEPATNLELGTKEPGTLNPGNLERTRNEEPNLEPRTRNRNRTQSNEYRVTGRSVTRPASNLSEVVNGRRAMLLHSKGRTT